MTQQHVVFCMQWMPSYRRGIFEALQPRLDESGVSMSVVHGLPPASRSRRGDHTEPSWARLVENREVSVKGIELTWQPVWKYAKNADLIVVQQEAANLFNYAALLRRSIGGPPVALWGHGENPDPANSNRYAEKLKSVTTPFADWFFAYTERSAAVFRSLGIAADRITVTNNSRAPDNVLFDGADASPEIRDLCAAVSERSERRGWMASALDESKRLPFLIATLDQVRERVPDFEFFALGRGPAEDVLFEAAKDRPWLHAVGARFGADKVAIGELASITIHPGLIGLHVIDSFSFETPMVTTKFRSHSHEFDYLEDGVNARVLEEDASPVELAEAAAAILDDASVLDDLNSGCAAAADAYSLEHMIDRFHDGVLGALDATGSRLHSTYVGE